MKKRIEEKNVHVAESEHNLRNKKEGKCPWKTRISKNLSNFSPHSMKSSLTPLSVGWLMRI